MRYGAMNFPVAPVLDEIAAIGRLDMDFIELAMDPPQANFRRIRGQIGEITREVERYKMGLVCHLPTFVYTAHLSDAIRRAFGICRITAQELQGCTGFRIWSGGLGFWALDLEKFRVLGLWSWGFGFGYVMNTSQA